jgi:putative ABC transport system permease protein
MPKKASKEAKRAQPPRLANALLEVFFNTYEVEEIQGDLTELFDRRLAESGPRAARRGYWLDAFRFLAPFSRRRKIQPLYPSPPPLAMLHNYLITSLRDARRNKLFTAINLAGLGTGLAAFLVIAHYVQFERSFDAFHARADRLYRVPFSWEPLARGKTDQVYASNVPAFGPALQADFPEVEAYARLFHVHTLLPYCVLTYTDGAGKKTSFDESAGYYADPSFLTMFTFPLEEGNPATALREPQSIVLTRAAARKYFGRENPVGKTLHVQNGTPSGPYTVTGILADVPPNSHLQFDFLFSYASLGSGSVQKSWVWSQFYTYVQLRPGTDPAALTARLPAFLRKHNGEKCDYETFLQPVRSIHLHSHLRYETSVNGSAWTVGFLLGMGVLILVIACVNYVNLASAKALERVREIGVRKAIGAGRLALFYQFLLEAFLATAAGLVVALALIALSIPLYLRGVTGGMIDFALLARPGFWALAGAVGLAGALLSGTYPALLLSAYRPVEALKGKATAGRGGLGLRRVLVTGQFAASVTLAILTGVVLGQFRFMRSQDLGIHLAQTLVVKTSGAPDSTGRGGLAYFRQELRRLPAVRDVTFSTAVPGQEITTSRGMKRLNGMPEGDTNFFLVGVDEHFTGFYGLELLAGRAFSPGYVARDQDRSVVVNERALEVLQLDDPARAVGEKVKIHGNPAELTIVGVLRNFHHKSLQNPHEPLVLYLHPYRKGYLSLQLRPGTRLATVLPALERVYRAAFPDTPFDYFFLDDYFHRQYRQEERNAEVFTAFAALALLIACLGLVGLTAVAITGRLKEIGVRKVHGAGTGHVAALLLRDLLRTVVLAGLVAWPLAYLLSTRWLAGYAFRMPLGWAYFVVPLAGVAAIALLCILYQTLKAARTRPAAFLREQ